MEGEKDRLEYLGLLKQRAAVIYEITGLMLIGVGDGSFEDLTVEEFAGVVARLEEFILYLKQFSKECLEKEAPRPPSFAV